VETSVVAPSTTGSFDLEVEADEVKGSINVEVVKPNYIIAKFTGTGSSVTFIYSSFTSYITKLIINGVV
jgi:hypothetical protein